MTMPYVFKRLSPGDLDLAMSILGGPREPDLTIAPDGKPYLYRWRIIPRGKQANVYFHIQVQSDPERPLHDHPWDNCTHSLAGMYRELIQDNPPNGGVVDRMVTKGDVVLRRASWAHRLILPEGVPYAMTLFTTGPKIREWGFWYQDEWVHEADVCRMIDGKSVHVKGKDQWK